MNEIDDLKFNVRGERENGGNNFRWEGKKGIPSLDTYKPIYQCVLFLKKKNIVIVQWNRIILLIISY